MYDTIYIYTVVVLLKERYLLFISSVPGGPHVKYITQNTAYVSTCLKMPCCTPVRYQECKKKNTLVDEHIYKDRMSSPHTVPYVRICIHTI